MAQTAGGTYYAASSELVSSWPATSLDLANQLESRFAAKANLASPALTGTPTAPTAANGTNTTQIATTAYVLANGGGILYLNSGSPSAVAATNITSAFSSTYQNYLIILSAISASSASNANLTISLLSGSTEATSNYQYGQTSVNTAGTAGSAGSSSAASWLLGPMVTGNNAASVIWINDPFSAARTFLDGNLFGGYNSSTGAITSYRTAGMNGNATSYDGFRLAIASGTFSCTWRLYGLKNS